MPEEEMHYPPGAEPEKPAEPETDAPKEEKPADTPAPEPEKPEDKKEDKEPQKPADTEEVKKPRSIYDEYKDKKQEAKDANARAEAAEARASELQALLDAKDDAKTPEAKAEVEADIKDFAEKQNLDPAALAELTSLIISRIPKVEMPEGLSPDEIKEWRASRATAQRDAEDRAIDAHTPAVKDLAKELGFEIQREEDVTKVMAEVKRLAHTAEFHDKDIDYIVFAKRAELSKLVSPKRGSFEAGGQNTAEGKDAPVDFDSGKGITPADAQRAMETGRSTPGLDIRRS